MDPKERERFSAVVNELAGLGHRGSGTDREREAAARIRARLAELGIESELQPFEGSHSWGIRNLVWVLVAALGAACLVRLPGLAAGLGLIALLGLLADHTTLGVRRLLFASRALSQNVLATIPAPGEARRVVLLCAHYDTQRTGWIFNPALQRLLLSDSRIPAFARSAILPVTLGMLAQCAIGAGLFRSVALPASGAILAIDAVSIVLIANWAWGAFVPGAVDNASGLAAALVLAERLRSRPIPGLEARLLFTGCEETGLLGAAAWADAHREARREVTFLNLDAVGGGPPRYFSSETPVVGPPVPYPRGLRALAAEAAAGLPSHPEPIALPGPTDGLAFLVRGFRGLTLCGIRRDGGLPNYHLPTDLPAGVDVEGASQGITFAWALLERLAVTAADTNPIASANAHV